MRSMPATTSHFYYRYPPDATGSEGGPRAEQSRRGGRKSATRRNITAACGSRTATGRSARAVGYCGAVPRLPSADVQGSRTPKTGRQKRDGGGCVPAPRRSRITAAQTTPPLPVRAAAETKRPEKVIIRHEITFRQERSADEEGTTTRRREIRRARPDRQGRSEDADGATAPCPIPARDGIPVRNDGATRRGACGGVAPARRVRDLRPQLAQRALRTGHRGPQAAVSPLRRGQNPQSRRTDAARAGIDAGQMPRAGACRRMLHGATRPGRRAAFRPHRRGHRPSRRCGRPIYPRCGRKPLVILRTRQNILSLSGRKIVLSLRRSRRREGTIAGKTVLDRRPAGTNLFRSRRTQKNKCRILNPNR